MDILGAILLLVGAAAGVWVLQFVWPRPRIVKEHERGLRFRRGHLVGEVGPGKYWLRPSIDELVVLDVRRRQIVVSGQEVLTADRVPLKVSLIAEFTVADARKAVIVSENYVDALYGRLQLALREVVAGRELDVALAERGELGAQITASVAGPAQELGLRLHLAQVRDFMMAGGLREAYANVLLAKQEGLAALERARGESAALRNLANTAELMERHPGLMQLRLLQAVEAGSGNKIVVALGRDGSGAVAEEATGLETA
jgi:regulator of protease activity HflC (stomatin/prohibitin superfamily)